MLHTVDLRKSNADKILSEAYQRLINLFAKQFAYIAKELHHIDQYQYARAYSAGLQEFIEAFTYYNYLKSERIIDWKDLSGILTYAVKADGEFESIEAAKSGSNVDDNATEPVEEGKLLVPPMEYMLGLADLSGEIMRKCINSLGNGDVDACNTTCNFIQNLYSG